MGTYTAPGRVPTDDYKYLGFATLKDATENHKYLVLTYTGNITQLRFEFVSMEDGSETGKIGPFWFNPEGQEKFFVTADGSAIPLVGDATTVVIDLEASGIDMATYNDGVHMHCDLMATNGDFEIGYARLSTTAEVKDVDQMPSQGGNEDPTTEAPTTEPTTEEPTTVDDKEEETTKKLTLKRVKKVKATKKAGAKKAKISFKKVKGAKKYQIQISTKKNFKKVIYKKTVKKTSVNIKTKKIKKNRKYYVRVRAINKSKNVKGKWSKVKKIKVKK